MSQDEANEFDGATHLCRDITVTQMMEFVARQNYLHLLKRVVWFTQMRERGRPHEYGSLNYDEFMRAHYTGAPTLTRHGHDGEAEEHRAAHATRAIAPPPIDVASSSFREQWRNAVDDLKERLVDCMCADYRSGHATAS